MLSIIIPTYNRVEPLKKCIESIIGQRYPGLEIIIVDDDSGDGTREYLLDISDRYSFIKVVFNSKNRGVNFSRNRGIELASMPYILFLDSDDFLAEGSLLRVRYELAENTGTTHFLFTVSDRVAEFGMEKDNRKIEYGDWVSGAVYGDFTHVIDSGLMKQFLFFEEFRMFEHLNWLRVKKTTAPQLLVPAMVAIRERDRTDSLTSSMKLKGLPEIQSKFESEKIFYSLYYPDLRKFNPRSLTRQLIETIMLGVACNKRNDCRILISYAEKLSVKILGSCILLVPSSLVKYGIVKYSALKGN